MDTTWYDLYNVVDDPRKLKVSVGLKVDELMRRALKEGSFTWDTW